MHLKEENCQNGILSEKLYGNGQMDRKFMILKKDPRAGLPSPGNIHVYYHNIQRSSLKPYGQSKTNIMWSILGKGK